MHEIRKLSPHGLWQLAPIRALIDTLLVVVKSGNGGQFTPLYMRMLAQQSESLREKVLENLNMRIKAWIMQCPARIIWVRCIIGETAIKHWRKNRLADYALSKYFGDWKHKWPHGFKNGGFENKAQQIKQMREPSFKRSIRDYVGKPFALIKIVNVSRFLYGRSAPDIDKTNKPKWTQPREKRARQPIRFTACELVADAATGNEETNIQNETEYLNDEHTVLGEQRALPSPSDPPPETKPP